MKFVFRLSGPETWRHFERGTIPLTTAIKLLSLCCSECQVGGGKRANRNVSQPAYRDGPRLCLKLHLKLLVNQKGNIQIPSRAMKPLNVTEAPKEWEWKFYCLCGVEFALRLGIIAQEEIKFYVHRKDEAKTRRHKEALWHRDDRKSRIKACSFLTQHPDNCLSRLRLLRFAVYRSLLNAFKSRNKMRVKIFIAQSLEPNLKLSTFEFNGRAKVESPEKRLKRERAKEWAKKTSANTKRLIKKWTRNNLLFSMGKTSALACHNN